MTPRRVAALFALVALAGCSSLTIQEDPTARIEKTLADFAAGLAARDADRVLATFIPYGEVAVPGWEPVRGPDAIRAWVRSLAVSTVLEQEFKGVSLQVVGPGAVQRGSFRRKERLGDGKVVETSGTFEADWERMADGSWRIARMTGNPPPQVVPTAGEVP